MEININGFCFNLENDIITRINMSDDNLLTGKLNFISSLLIVLICMYACTIKYYQWSSILYFLLTELALM